MIIIERDKVSNINTHYNIFTAINCKAPQIYSEIKTVINSFNKIFPSIQDFIITKEAKYRDILIKHLSVQEEMFIENILKTDIDNVIHDAIVCKSIRVFLVNSDFNFEVLQYNTLDNTIYSIFIGNKFYDDENNHLKLIHELGVRILDSVLNSYNIDFDTIGSDEYLIIRDFFNPMNVEFAFQYYRFLFLVIINNTSRKVDFNYLKNELEYYKSHLAFSDKSMQLIWDMVEEDLSGNVSDHTFKKVLITIHRNEME